jgi:hypothetical protein
VFEERAVGIAGGASECYAAEADCSVGYLKIGVRDGVNYVLFGKECFEILN